MRKLLMVLVLLGLCATALIGCGGKPTAMPVPTETPVVAPNATEALAPTATPTSEPAKLKEAPDLAAQVKAGSLPAVENRLPEKPLATAPIDEIGKYGGTLFTASGDAEVGNVQAYFATDAPIKWKADLTGYEPALVESYEWSADGRTFTMHLRKGLRWSDGQPYTSADWKFMWEDLMNAPDQTIYSVPAYLRNKDGTPIMMEFPDDDTVVWKAADRPLWIDPYYMAQGYGAFARNMMKPAHYLKRFHPKYTSTATWDDLAEADRWWQTPGYPCLFAWCSTAVSSDATRYTFGRNPYYWRVDPDGQQLPYIDAIEVEIIADAQARLANCVQGKYDTAFRICGGPGDVPALLENASKGGYRLLKGWTDGAGAWPGYMVNQYYVEGGENYADDTPEHASEIRDLLRDKRFRQALSLGIDREAVIDAVWGGRGSAKQATLSPQSPHFATPQGQSLYQVWSRNQVQFSAAAANVLLDAVGMKKGADGFRMLPSGKPLVLTIDVSGAGAADKVQIDSAAEVKVQWETNLGIAVEVKEIADQAIADTRESEGYAMLKSVHAAGLDAWADPGWLFPVTNRYWFPLEARYWARGKDACVADPAAPYSCGVKPAAGSPAERLQLLYERGLLEGDLAKRDAIVREAIQIHVDDGPFIIGIAGDQEMPVVVKDTMRNVLDYGIVGPLAPVTPGNQVAAQWWIAK